MAMNVAMRIAKALVNVQATSNLLRAHADLDDRLHPKILGYLARYLAEAVERIAEAAMIEAPQPAAPAEHSPPWQRAWREGLSPLLSTDALESLCRGLESDDPALIQGAPSDPRPDLPGALDWPVRGACALCYGDWRAGAVRTVEEADALFQRTVRDADEKLFADPGLTTTAFFLDWFDRTPRAEMVRQLLPEVRRALDLRTLGEAL